MQAFLPVLLVIHIIACVALVIAVMLQRSEGGALGMGGGGTGGIISGRGVANVLVRTTMGLAAVFFVTSVLMARLNTEAAKAPSAVERALKARKIDVFDPLKTPTAVPAPGAAAPSSLAPTTPAATTTAPAAPVRDPLAAPTTSTSPPTATTTAPAPAPAITPAIPPAPAVTGAPKPAAVGATPTPAKPRPKPPAEPAKPTTAPAAPDTAPATPGPAENSGNNGQ